MEEHIELEYRLEGYDTKNFPLKFNKILGEWFNVIHDYNELAPDDCLYWYGERTNVSAFGASLARNRYTYLQEYTDTKLKEENESAGRVDLWFHDGEEGYAIEAKHKFLTLKSVASVKLDPASLLKDAVADTARTALTERGYSEFFALTFVVPKIPSTLIKRGNISYHEQLTDIVKQYIEQLKVIEYCDCWAYCAPKSNRELSTTLADGQKYYYPMSILLAKFVDMDKIV